MHQGECGQCARHAAPRGDALGEKPPCEAAERSDPGDPPDRALGGARIEAFVEDRPESGNDHGPERGDVQVDGDRRGSGIERRQPPLAEAQDRAHGETRRNQACRSVCDHGARGRERNHDGQPRGAGDHHRKARDVEAGEKHRVARRFGSDQVRDHQRRATQGAGRNQAPAGGCFRSQWTRFRGQRRPPLERWTCARKWGNSIHSTMLSCPECASDRAATA